MFNLLGEREGNSRNGGDGLNARLRESVQGSERLDQGLLAFRPNAGDLIEPRGEAVAAAESAMVGDGEPVCLVTDLAQQEERLALGRKANRLGLIRPLQGFVALGKADCLDPLDFKFAENG